MGSDIKNLVTTSTNSNAPYCNSDNVVYTLLDIVSLIICISAFCFVCIVALPAIRGMHEQNKVKRSLKCTFYAAILTAFFIILCAITMTLVCMGPMPTFNVTPYVFSMAWGCGSSFIQALMVCLLVNLFLRLDVTFGESALAMSTTKRRLFLVSIFLEICLIASSLIFGSATNDFEILWAVGTTMLWIFWFLYVLISFALVREFINNLMRMAKYSVGPSQNASNLQLNKTQQQQVNLSAKYLALYFVAATSSLLYGLYLLISSLTEYVEPYQIYWSLVVIDVSVNICCLILSYGTMSSVYTLYCYRLDKHCKRLTTAAMKKRVRRILADKDSKESIERIQTEESDVLLTKTDGM